mgnify:CR=1 FL=1
MPSEDVGSQIDEMMDVVYDVLRLVRSTLAKEQVYPALPLATALDHFGPLALERSHRVAGTDRSILFDPWTAILNLLRSTQQSNMGWYDVRAAAWNRDCRVLGVVERLSREAATGEKEAKQEEPPVTGIIHGPRAAEDREVNHLATESRRGSIPNYCSLGCTLDSICEAVAEADQHAGETGHRSFESGYPYYFIDSEEEEGDVCITL